MHAAERGACHPFARAIPRGCTSMEVALDSLEFGPGRSGAGPRAERSEVTPHMPEAAGAREGCCRARRRQGERRAHDPQPGDTCHRRDRLLARPCLRIMCASEAAGPRRRRPRARGGSVRERRHRADRSSAAGHALPSSARLSARQALSADGLRHDRGRSGRSAAVALRWGSYFAVLADRSSRSGPKPARRAQAASRLGDGAHQHRGVSRAGRMDRPVAQEPRTCAQLAARAAAYYR